MSDVEATLRVLMHPTIEEPPVQAVQLGPKPAVIVTLDGTLPQDNGTLRVLVEAGGFTGSPIEATQHLLELLELTVHLLRDLVAKETQGGDA